MAGGLLAGLLLAAPRPARAWGVTVHQAVTARAIDALPKPLKGFYERHRLELPALAPEAELPAEGPERRFAIDRVQPFPFLELPRSEEGVRQRFGEGAGQIGRLPWLLLESYGRLVEAFRANDKARILSESDLLAQLVTDLHNPLALSDNHDGHKTNQHGLWVRLGVKLPEAMRGGLKLDPDAAHLLDDPRAFVFSMINGTYIWLDNLLYQEELAKRGKGGYGEIYFEDLITRAGPLVKERLSEAAGHAGSYWYTAWTAAGKPVLK